MSIEIKGITVPALVIRIPENKNFEKSIKELEKKLSSAFFKGSLAIIEHNKALSKEEKEKIEELLKKHNTGILAYRQLSNSNNLKEKKSLKIINKTVRSGQRIEYDGDVLIIGDVNPDAYVIASGNIIVMGTLRGIVHAGANGDETAVVMALKLKPQQLRIASCITRSPDEPLGEPEYPEKAFIENNQIFIEKI